jgi:hypothetical protein
VLTEEVPHPAEVRDRIAALEERMIEALSALFAHHPAIRVRDPDLAARMVAGLLEAATHRWATDARGAPIDRATLVDELARMIAAYLAAR